MLDIRSLFPIYEHNPNLCYLDSAASCLKPQVLVEAVREYYEECGVNIHRGLYELSEQATNRYEETRGLVAEFLGGVSPTEVVFTSGATESINLVAFGMRELLSEGDSLVVTMSEHHANFVPWQQLANMTGAELRFADLNDDGLLNVKDLLLKVDETTRLVALPQVSNVLGVVNRISSIIHLIKLKNPQCWVLVDGSQAVAHIEIDLNDLGCDFYVFSAHKLYGPTGVGVLWGKIEALEMLDVYQTGGDMIERVETSGTEFAAVPHRFEAGTPNIAGVWGLGAVLKWWKELDRDEIWRTESKLVTRLYDELDAMESVRLLGGQERSSLLAFVVDGVHAHDVAQVLAEQDICVRAGHHCAMPLHREVLGIAASVRVSLGMYNTRDDLERLLESLQLAMQQFKK